MQRVIEVVGVAPTRWEARRAGSAAGRLLAHVRHDRRCCLHLSEVADDEVYGRLVDTAIEAVPGDLYVEVDEQATGALEVLTARGFTVHRRTNVYTVPTDTANATFPDGYTFVSMADTDLDRLRELEDALRADLPGPLRERNDPTEFAGLVDDPGFDPATFLVAVTNSGDYVGLIRGRTAAGSGLIGVLPAHRRTGLARALLALVFDVLRERGNTKVRWEADAVNVASNSLALGLGARRVGGNVELLRRAP